MIINSDYLIFKFDQLELGVLKPSQFYMHNNFNRSDSAMKNHTITVNLGASVYIYICFASNNLPVVT